MLHRRSVLLAPLALLLAGCDDEPAQRKAFISFLQTRILDRPGVHIPRPTEAETKSWGPYAKHYAVITDFDTGTGQRVSRPMQEAMARGTPHSLQELVDRRADLEAVQQGMQQLRPELDRQLAAAEAARAALQFPADLKPVYDAAYERDVIVPARTVADILPSLSDALAAALSLADFLAQNRAKIRINGPLIETADPALQREVQARIAAMNGKAQQVQAAQQRLQALISGG
jgi:hypothetical protein